MILAIDVGNTNIIVGLFKGMKLTKKISIPTAEMAHAKSVRLIRKAYFGRTVNKVLICSVVPGVNSKLSAILKSIFKVQPLLIGKDVMVPIKNLYKLPHQVGQDRLINAYAGKLLYGSPIVIIDFGTAVTFDIVNKNGSYLGGLISPGIDLSLNALSEKTALLPKVRLKKITPLVGKTTSASIASGMIYGYASMCDGILSKLKNKLKLNFKSIATGGNAGLISRASEAVKNIDGDLTLKGIVLAYLASEYRKNPSK